MRPSAVFWQLAVFLVYPAAILTGVIYTYPILFGCSFPAPGGAPQTQCMLKPDPSVPPPPKNNVAPFRLLVIGDPQLEGDSSLPHPDDPVFPGLAGLAGLTQARSLSHVADILEKAAVQTVKDDIPLLLWSYRKRLDLWGNDRYLAHIYRSVKWWSNPTHITVVGDLLGSQWISDDEFERRASRFWNVVFKGEERVDDTTALARNVQVLGQDVSWSRKIINVAGNHDVGYSGDLTRHRLDRFERAFGKANWEQRFVLPMSDSEETLQASPELRIVVLNSMNLDGPTLDYDLMTETYDFMGKVLDDSRPVEDTTQATVLLTHIPLAKKAGLCADSAYFDYGTQGIKEQNHLSKDASRAILGGIFGKSGFTDAPHNGLGRNGIILTGHDHVGCDVYHHLQRGNQLDGADFSWDADITPLAGKYMRNRTIPGVREITMRSIMGDFSGYTGLLSGWFDEDDMEWKFAFMPCPFAVQHLWWAVHIADIIVGLLFAAYAACAVRESSALQQQTVHINGHAKAANANGGAVKGSITPTKLNGGASKKNVKKSKSNGYLQAPDVHASGNQKSSHRARSPNKKG